MDISKINSLVELYFKKCEKVGHKKTFLKWLTPGKSTYTWGNVQEKVFKLSYKIKSLINISNKLKTPILFSKSTYPYKTIGILINNDFGESTSNSIAFDLAASLSASLTAVNVSQPKFLQSEESSKLSDSIEKLQDLALSHEVQLDLDNQEGNEAKIFSDLSTNFDLSIIGSGMNKSWQSRKTIEYITNNSKSSVLYIPS